MKYDYLVVGSGLFGATFAYRAKEKGKKVLILEKRHHIGGNLFCKNIEGIQVHQYGPHIFHTSNKKVWDFVTSLVHFNDFQYNPLASYRGHLYHLPFNMNTFWELWGTKTPEESKAIIEKQRQEITGEPQNLEEQAISMVGREIYEKLIKGYTEKQWGRECKDLPPFIIKRLPVRFSYDNNYYNDLYQGIPIGGYNKLIEKLIDGVEVRLNTDYLTNRTEYNEIARMVVYTGPIDAFFNYQYGPLEYRSLRFEEELHHIDNYQNCVAVNYTDLEHSYTRIIEHKYFEFGTQPHTVITKEYPQEWIIGMEPYYPVNDEKNNARYALYKAKAKMLDHVIMGGRLADYQYYDMDDIIEKAHSVIID